MHNASGNNIIVSKKPKINPFLDTCTCRIFHTYKYSQTTIKINNFGTFK